MMITAELGALLSRVSAPRPLPDDEGTPPVFASATLRPGLPEAPASARNARPNKGVALAKKDSVSLEPAAYRREDKRQGDADGLARRDRRKSKQAVLIDTRSTRGRRESDLNAMINFEI